MRRSTSILRKHRAGDKVYLPSDSRDNQYILAEIPLTDKLLESVAIMLVLKAILMVLFERVKLSCYFWPRV